MSAKSTLLQRKILIIRKILHDNKHGRYPGIKDIINYVEEQFNRRDLNDTSLSVRTIKRDFSDITNHFQIALLYNHKEKGYFIDSKLDEIINEVLSSFEIMASLGADHVLPDYIIPEKRKSDGTEHFSFLASCIRQRQRVVFDYRKHDTGAWTTPDVAPYGLKSSRQRWYLIGVPKGETQIKAYGLDRIHKPAKYPALLTYTGDENCGVDARGYRRYHKTVIGSGEDGERYILCNHWFESNRAKLEEWATQQ